MKNRPPLNDNGNGFLNFTVALTSRDMTGLSNICGHFYCRAVTLCRYRLREFTFFETRAPLIFKRTTHFEFDVRLPDPEVVLPEILVVRVDHVRQARYVEHVLALHVVTIVEVRQSGLNVFDVRTCGTR